MVPVVAPALPVEFTEPLVLALVLPVAPIELPVEPVVPVVPIVPVEPELAPLEPVGPVVEFGVVVLVVAELLGRVPVVLLCPEVAPMPLGLVAEVEPGFVVLDCPTVLPGVVPAVVPGVPTEPPG